MRERKKRKNKTNRKALYIRPPEFKSYPKIYLKDETLIPYFIKMYNSLDIRQLVTKKYPAPDPKFIGHEIRGNDNTNSLWFRNLSAYYINNRTKKRNRKDKPDTKIQGIQVQKALRNFVKNGYSFSAYAEDFIKIAKTLKKQEIKATIYFVQKRNLNEIAEECSELIDLQDISNYLEEDSFKIAEKFNNCYNSLEKRLSKVEDRFRILDLGDEVPF